jgi:deoxyribodipyrimidine photo-lyase
MLKNSTLPHYNKSLVWFRRDLRSFDHAALHHALTHSDHVYCAFVFDRDILDNLPTADRRIEFIHESLQELAIDLHALGGDLLVRHGIAVNEIVGLAAELGVEAVFANRDYEPQAIERDREVEKQLATSKRSFLCFKDQVIFESDEVLSLAEKTFSVFTPYKRAWLKKLDTTPVAGKEDFYLTPYPIDTHKSQFARNPVGINGKMPSLAELGFEKTNLSSIGIPTGMSGGTALFQTFMPRMGAYTEARNFPGIKGPSYLSVHLRFGTVSVRALAKRAIETIRADVSAGSGAETWLSELIWRDFYFMILHTHPQVREHAFKPEYEKIEFEQGKEADELFQAWCEGRTGYPLVDAAMAQINQTGYMHNRLRMVTASFLIKDLGIDWRSGERYFAEKLNDFDLSANNGGWQWASSSGCDAQPYFRIFNPITQSEKFDGEGKFIRRYLPQLAKLDNKIIHAPWLASADALTKAGIVLGDNYPYPLVKHDEARQRTLARYAVVKKVSAGN